MTPFRRLVAWYVPSIGALAAVPFLAPVLADRGLTDTQIAAVLSLQPASILVAAPAWAWLADRTGRVRTVLVVVTVASAVGLLSTALPLGIAGSTLAIALFAVHRAPQVPIVDALAVHALPEGGRRYGRVRLWGSLAFLVVAGIDGWARVRWGPAPVVIGAVLLLLCAPMVIGLPGVEATGARPARGDFLRLLKRRDMLLLGAACVLHGVGLAFYNLFFARHVEVLGLPATVAGWSLVVAVAVEIGVMAVAPRLLGRRPPEFWLALSFAGSVPRWLGTAWVSDPVGLAALQGLHGLTFALFWVAAVAAFGARAPKGLERTAQSLLPATSFGLGPLLGLLVATQLLASRTTADLFLLGAGAAALATLVLLPTALGSRSSRAGRP